MCFPEGRHVDSITCSRAPSCESAPHVGVRRLSDNASGNVGVHTFPDAIEVILEMCLFSFGNCYSGRLKISSIVGRRMASSSDEISKSFFIKFLMCGEPLLIRTSKGL